MNTYSKQTQNTHAHRQSYTDRHVRRQATGVHCKVQGHEWVKGVHGQVKFVHRQAKVVYGHVKGVRSQAKGVQGVDFALR